MKIHISKYACIFTVFMVLMGMVGCATRPLRFRDADPVLYFNDIHSIPVPKDVQRDRFDYYATVLPVRPELRANIISQGQHSLDVNSIDEVPASSWYLPRLGFDNISPQELLDGPNELGPPRTPITVIKVRSPDHNPRLFVYDRRRIYYLLKFDPPGYPNIATNSSFIVNRLFWGFGYHVPEDHLVYLRRENIRIDPESLLSQTDLDTILTRVAQPINGQYKALASRIIEGLPLGTALEKGVRRDDPNDLFPHEKRRVLRGLRVFCALTNMVDISADNTLDIYVGEEGKGFIKHHLVDFDDAFGTLAAKEKKIWAGYNRLFNVETIVRNLFTLGLSVEGWEKIRVTPWKSVGSFESTFFKPKDWKETHPFDPIRRSQHADNYWAAKIVGALTREHIKILVEKSHYPEAGAEDYIIQTLMERRQKILNYYFSLVTPIELEQYDSEKLIFKDVAFTLMRDKIHERIYSVRFYDGADREIIVPMNFLAQSHTLMIPFETSWINRAKGYLRIDISIDQENNTTAVPAQFHFRQSPESELRLVGVVH